MRRPAARNDAGMEVIWRRGVKERKSGCPTFFCAGPEAAVMHAKTSGITPPQHIAFSEFAFNVTFTTGSINRSPALTNKQVHHQSWSALTATSLVAFNSALKLWIFASILSTQSDPRGSLSTLPFKPPAIPVPATASTIREAHFDASPGGPSPQSPK